MPPAPNASMPSEPAAGVWLRGVDRKDAIGAHEGEARLAEALHVHLVADAVSRAAVPNAETAARAAQEQVLVGVQVVVLNEVVVDILRGEPNLHLLDAHGLKFEHHQRAEHVLQKGLIDGKRDLIARSQRAHNKMRAHKLLR